MKYHFEHRPAANGIGGVRLVYRTQGERSTLGLGIVVHSQEWDSGKAFLKSSSPMWSRLAAIRAAVDGLVLQCLRDAKDITTTMVRAMVRGEEVPEELTEETKQVDVWEWLYAFAAAKTVISTAGAYRAALVSFQRFEGSTPTPATLRAWNAWLTTKSGKSAGTTHTYLGAMRAMLDQAKEQGIIDWTPSVDRPSLPAKRGKVALTDKQVRALEKMKLDGDLDLVRDLFLMGCYCSFRRADWDRRTTDLGTVVNTVKTNGSALVVDHPKLRALLGKYGGHLHLGLYYREHLNNTSNVLRFDEALAKVMEQLAGKCSELREVVSHRGKMVPRWQAIGSHSGRKTFVSKYATRLPLPTVMRATGHKSLAQFAVYVQNLVDDKETAKLFR